MITVLDITSSYKGQDYPFMFGTHKQTEHWFKTKFRSKKKISKNLTGETMNLSLTFGMFGYYYFLFLWKT